MTKYEKVFLEQAQFGNLGFIHKYIVESKLKELKEKQYALYERRNKLDRKFRFTKRNIERLDKLNKLLAEKELWAHKHARRLEKVALKEMKKKDSQISDYEIECDISLYSEKKFKGIEHMEGNPFYEDKGGAVTFIKYQPDASRQKEEKEAEQWKLNENHNEFQHSDEPPFRKPHPLQKQHHCYLFHHLYDHTFLAWQDLLDIDMIWMDVQLIIQRGTRMKGKKVETILYK